MFASRASTWVRKPSAVFLNPVGMASFDEATRVSRGNEAPDVERPPSAAARSNDRRRSKVS